MRRLLIALAVMVPGVAWGQTGSPPIPAALRPALVQAAASATRAPTATDDTTRGYAVGSIWTAGGRQWVATRVTAGAAVWSRNYPLRALDQFMGATVAYSTVLLNSSYTGASLKLTRASDSTSKDIGFVAGVVDAATADAFCLNTACYVSFYDQSGNANNGTGALPASGASGPQWITGRRVNGIPAVSWASNAHAITGQAALNQYEALPAALSVTISSSTILYAGQMLNSGGELSPLLYNSTVNRGWLASFGSKGISTIGFGTGCPIYVPSSPSVWAVAASSSAMTCAAGNEIGINASGYSAQAASTGWTIGGSTAGGMARMDLTAVVLWPTTFTNANIQAALASVAAQTATPFQYDDAIVVLGDSMSMGEGSTINTSWPYYLPGALLRSARLYNNSVFGYTTSGVQGALTNLAANFYTGIGLSAKKTTYFVLLIGANDIRSGNTTQTQSNIQSTVSALKSYGSNVKVVIATYPMQCDFAGNASYTSSLASLNAWISGGGSGADLVADLRADPTLGASTTGGPSGFCVAANSPDGQHPTDSYMQFYAPIVAPVINLLTSP